MNLDFNWIYSRRGKFVMEVKNVLKIIRREEGDGINR